jgi:hypothetical protein
MPFNPSMPSCCSPPFMPFCRLIPFTERTESFHAFG